MNNCTETIKPNMTNVLYRKDERGIFRPMIGQPDPSGGLEWIDLQRAAYAQEYGVKIGAKRVEPICGNYECSNPAHLILTEDDEPLFAYFAERVALDEMWNNSPTPSSAPRAERRRRDRRRRR